MTEKTDLYEGVPRLWRGGSVYHGMVKGRQIKPKNCPVLVSVYCVRENGETLYQATSGSGPSRKALQLARDVAQRQGLIAVLPVPETEK